MSKEVKRYHSEWCDRMNGGFECNCEAGDLEIEQPDEPSEHEASNWGGDDFGDA